MVSGVGVQVSAITKKPSDIDPLVIPVKAGIH
jgi:hypothetical protein